MNQTQTDIAKAKTNLITVLAKFIGPAQKLAVANALRGEERAWFAAKVNELADVVAKMPHSYQTDGQGGDAVAHLHYFRGDADAWITEKDKDGGTPQAFGKIDLGFGGELGYISIDELVQSGCELDFHWEPKPIKECK